MKAMIPVGVLAAMLIASHAWAASAHGRARVRIISADSAVRVTLEEKRPAVPSSQESQDAAARSATVEAGNAPRASEIQTLIYE